MKSLQAHLTDDVLMNNWYIAKLFKIQQKETEWLKFIALLANIEPENILEIGSYDGGSTISLSLLCKNLITIEYIPPRYDVNIIKQECNFTYIQGDSTSPEIINLFKLNPQTKFDVIFIDGGHEYNTVKQDFLNYKQFIKPGGIIAMHDIIESDLHKAQNTTVYKFWNEVKNNFKNLEIIEPPLDWGGIGLLWMP